MQYKAHKLNVLLLPFLLISDLFLYVSLMSQKIKKTKNIFSGTKNMQKSHTNKIVCWNCKSDNQKFFLCHSVPFVKRNQNCYYFLIDSLLFSFCSTDYIYKQRKIDHFIVCLYIRFWYSIEYQNQYSIEYLSKIDQTLIITINFSIQLTHILYSNT